MIELPDSFRKAVRDTLVQYLELVTEIVWHDLDALSRRNDEPYGVVRIYAENPRFATADNKVVYSFETRINIIGYSSEAVDAELLDWSEFLEGVFNQIALDSILCSHPLARTGRILGGIACTSVDYPIDALATGDQAKPSDRRIRGQVVRQWEWIALG